MDFTFDCILLKDNKAVREDITIPISQLPEEYINAYNYVNKSLQWLKEIGVIGIKTRLSKNPTNTLLIWKDIYDNHIYEKCSLIEDLEKNFHFNLFYNHYGYMSTYRKTFYKSIKFDNDIFLKIEKIDSILELNEDELERFSNVIYNNFEELLNNVKNIHLLNFAIDNLLIGRKYLSNIMFVKPYIEGRYSQKHIVKDINFIWELYTETKHYGFNKFTISFLNRNLIYVHDSPDSFSINIKTKEYRSPFYDIDVINLINECLNDNSTFKLNFAKSQIRELKRVLKFEEEFTNLLENNILPELHIKKLELSLILAETDIVEEVIEKNKKELLKIDDLISKYTRIESSPTNYDYTAISIYEKKARINLLKIEINFWIDWINGEADLLLKV